MSGTFVQPGQVLEHANSSGAAISAGSPVVMGDLVGIALVDIPDGESGSVSITGVHKVPKVAGVAWAQGEKVDWDASAPGFTTGITPAAGDVESAGVAARAALTADTEAELLLLPGIGTGS